MMTQINKFPKNLRINVNLTVDGFVNPRNVLSQSITAFAWTPVTKITETIEHETGISTDRQRLFYRGSEITDMKKNSPKDPTLSFFGIKNGSSIYLQCSKAQINNPIVAYGMSIHLSDEEELLLKECRNGLLNGQKPLLVNHGESGTYFLLNDRNEKQAIFKPFDEEIGCINNSSVINASVMKQNYGIKPGECYLREVGAYLIDPIHIPCTVKVEIISDFFDDQSCKIGSLQQFKSGDVIENFGTSFHKNFQRREVHKIGILDIRILNCDRSSGNLLVGKNEYYSEGKKYYMYELIPIDHGLTFPEKLNITSDSWIWLNWEQSKQPFDPYTIEYINNINIEEDINKLQNELKLSLLALENIRITHLVLKKSMNLGLTLYQIASIMIRVDEKTPSMLEKLLFHAEQLAKQKYRQNKDYMIVHKPKALRLRNKSIVVKQPPLSLRKSRRKSLDDGLPSINCHGLCVMKSVERILNESNDVIREYFLHYIDRLLDIQCERIINNDRKQDTNDNIYDIDSVRGSFIWKNDIRRYWKSRRELKEMHKLEQQIKYINPFDTENMSYESEQDLNQQESFMEYFSFDNYQLE